MTSHPSPRIFYTPCDAHQAGALLYTNSLYRQIDSSKKRPTKTNSWSRIRKKWMKEQETLYGKANLICSICGKQHLNPWGGDLGSNKHKLSTIDHILPISKYPHLWNIPTNFQIACYHCNTTKNNKC